jgi:hypothetical protein
MPVPVPTSSFLCYTHMEFVASRCQLLSNFWIGDILLHLV